MLMLYRVLQFQRAEEPAGEHPQQGRQQQHPQRAAGISPRAYSTSFGSDIHPHMGDEVITQCYLLLSSEAMPQQSQRLQKIV